MRQGRQDQGLRAPAAYCVVAVVDRAKDCRRYRTGPGGAASGSTGDRASISGSTTATTTAIAAGCAARPSQPVAATGGTAIGSAGRVGELAAGWSRPFAGAISEPASSQPGCEPL